ncbi:Probable splicing factor, arginine/serine-rich 7 [Harpegnathos saltator]|uniref:Probable splicing factor, arginine/serine-rich 7 n=1 Tax=Harpegnathos saltator TaxID=610380 RepID=E2BXG3_HARSA|nr:Probable splicing factor, arginine/serine-rich 7 [Harpegnathos saltator]
MAVGSTKVVQVTNIAPQATKDQMQTLFGYLGKIEDIRLYPTIRDVAVPVQSRICYIKFHDQGCVAVAQHMTNTVFIDRALIVIPYQNGDIPDEQRLYPSEPKLPPNVVNAIEGIPPNHVITTMDPKLEANGLPPYPHLPGHLDSRRIEEIRRTLIVANLDASVSAEQLLEFFSNNNVEIKYLRMCSRDSDTEHYALVELSEQGAVVAALLLNGKSLAERPIKIYHSTQAIAKPEAKSNEAAQKEIEEAMSRVKEAHNLISAAIDPMIGMLSKDKRRAPAQLAIATTQRFSQPPQITFQITSIKVLRAFRKSIMLMLYTFIYLTYDFETLSRRSPSRSKERKKRSPRRRSRSRSRSKRSKSRSRRSRSKSKSRSSKSKYSDKSKDKDRERRSKDKSDNGKKSDSDRERPEKESKSEKKRSSKEKKSSDKSESKSEEKGRSASESNDSKEKTAESEN